MVPVNLDVFHSKNSQSNTFKSIGGGANKLRWVRNSYENLIDGGEAYIIYTTEYGRYFILLNKC